VKKSGVQSSTLKGVNSLPYELQESGAGVDLVVKGQWTSSCQDVVATGAVDGLVLNTAYGFTGPDLEFLKPWRLSRLRVLARHISDLSPVYRLSESLSDLDVLTAPSAFLDLSELPNVVSLGADWGQVSETLPKLATIKKVFLRHFDSADLQGLRGISELESIRLKDRPKLISLDGLEDLTHLTELGIFLATKLKDISALSSVAAPLQKLELVACKGIHDIRPLQSLTSLKYLNISECGDIESVHPLSSLQDLEEFHAYGSTKISDGDLSPLLQVPHLRVLSLQSRKFYTPSRQEISEALHLP
jgi:Leucine-rich repeat (LRR) protein